MNNKPIKQLSPLNLFVGAPDYIKNILLGQASPSRASATTSKFDVEGISFYVDTCCPDDTNLWETAVQRGHQSMVIVEQYPDSDNAHVGHAKWVGSLKTNPKQVLHDINIFGLSNVNQVYEDNGDE